MARKRKKRLSGRRRSRRVSGLGGVNLGNVGAVVAGAVVAGYINKLIPPTVNDKIVAGGKVAIGIALPLLFKGKSQSLAAAAGAGLIAVGAVDLLKSFNVLSGDFDIPTINGDVLTGDDLDVINGIDGADGADDAVGFDEVGGGEDDDD